MTPGVGVEKSDADDNELQIGFNPDFAGAAFRAAQVR
jgi:hypothetical protein